MAVTFEDAIRKAIKAYWKDKEPRELKKATKPMKYNKKYFEGVEKEFLGEVKDHGKSDK